jgi:hypothetical protein
MHPATHVYQPQLASAGRLVETGFLVNFPDFIQPEQPVPALAQTSEAHRSVSNAADLQNRVPDRLAHALYLTVPTLMESNPDPGGVWQFANYFNTGRGRYALRQPDT